MVQHNFIKLYEKSFSENWDFPALSDYNGTSFTYGEVAGQMARLHMLFESQGIKKGDKIAVFGKNSSHWCIASMSVFCYGAVLVPILADFKPDNAHTIINHSDAVMLFVDRQIMDSLTEAELTNIGAILSLDDFGILSTKPSVKFMMDTMVLLFWCLKLPLAVATSLVILLRNLDILSKLRRKKEVCRKALEES